MTDPVRAPCCRLRFVLFMVVVLTLPAVPGVADERYYQFATTGSYLSASESMRTGYVAGLLDGALAFGLLPEATASCLTVMRLREIRAGFDRWLRNHPAEWRFSLPSNFTIAIRHLCEY